MENVGVLDKLSLMGCGRTCIYVRVIKSVHVKMVLTKATHVFLATRYKPKCSSMEYSVYSVLSYTLLKLFYSYHTRK